MTTLVDKVLAIAASLDDADLPWAFGGALALAYATEEPRGTRDIDVNIFVTAQRAVDVFSQLPAGVRYEEASSDAARADGQVRLMWDDTPIDIFFENDPFHRGVRRRRRQVPFAGATIWVLSAEDLAVFKAMFDRAKDWVDIATMAESGALDAGIAADRLASVLGNDPRVRRLRTIS